MKGNVIIVSAPSGAGKTSLVKELVGRDPAAHKSVSYTTRPRRTGETDGLDYHFVDSDTFERMLESGANRVLLPMPDLERDDALKLLDEYVEAIAPFR